MKSIFTAVLVFTALRIGVVNAEEACADGSGWQCLYPSAYCTNFLQGVCGNYSLSGSFLYWRLNSDSNDYLSIKQATDNGAGEMILADQEIENFGGSWTKGFRVGLGAEFCEWGADTEILWTHFFSNHENHTLLNGVAAPQFVSFDLLQVPEIGATIPLGQFADITGACKFRYDVIDLDVGRWICLCDWLKIRPIIGLRYADIEDKMSSAFIFSGNFVTNNLLSGSYSADNHFRGIGLKGGMDFEFPVWCGLSFVGRGSAAYAFGRSHWKLSFDGVRVDDTLPVATTKKGYDTGRAFLEASLGLRYTTDLLGCYPLLFDFRWEQNYICGGRRYLVDDSVVGLTASSVNNSKRDDLILSGLTVMAEIDF